MEWYLRVLIYFWLLVRLSCFQSFLSIHISSPVISLFILVLYFPSGFLKAFSCWYSYLVLIYSWLCLIDVANAFSHSVSCFSHFVCSGFWWIDVFMFWCQKNDCRCLLLPYSLHSPSSWALLIFLSYLGISPCQQPLGQALLRSPLPDNCIHFSVDPHFHSRLDTMFLSGTLKDIS